MPFPNTRFSGFKRKLPYIDTEDFVSQPEDVYSDLEADPPLHPARRRRINEWAQAYLRGESIFIASAALRGSFDKTSARSPSRTNRKRARSIAESEPDDVESTENRTASASTDIGQHDEDNMVNVGETVQSRGITVNLPASEDLLKSIEGEHSDPPTPIVIVQGRPVFPHQVINNNGEIGTLTREVRTWPHNLRMGNQIDRLEAARRPYVQNTSWTRPKIIPPFDPTRTSVSQPGGPQDISPSVLQTVEKWVESSQAGTEQTSGPESIVIPDIFDTAHVEESRPSTPTRQIIRVDSQYLVVADHPDLLRHQESCQTAELLDGSQTLPGVVHDRLQKILHSSPPPLAGLEEEYTDLFARCRQQKASPPLIHLPSAPHVSESFYTELDLKRDKTTEPLVKLKQLEDAIDRQFTTTFDQSSRIDSNVLVSSSFDDDSHSYETHIPLDENSKNPTGSASTDRVTSSQPEERPLSPTTSVAQRDPRPMSFSKKTSKNTSFEQSSIKKAFQVHKSFEGKSQTPGKQVVQSSIRLSDTLAVTTDLTTNSPLTHARASASSVQTHLPRKGILTYAKRRGQSSLCSNSRRNASFLDILPKSQRELQRAAIETHGYNYDVEDEFDLDGTIDELGSYLSSWDREKDGIRV